MKQINFTVTSGANGSLQSFNNTINDQVGPDIVALIGTAVQIGGAAALLSVGAPPVAPAPLQTENLKAAVPPDYCSEYLSASVKTALDNIAKQNALKKTITSNPATSTAAQAAQTQELQAIQNEIDSQTKKGKLARSFSYKWIPSRKDNNAIFRQ